MSREEKQEYLRVNVLEKGYESDVFISFLEDQRIDGANIDSWTLDELKSAVQEFLEHISEGENLTRRATTKGEQLALFGSDLQEKEESSEEEKRKSRSSSSSDLSNEYKQKAPKKKEIKQDQDSSSEDEEEIKKDENKEQLPAPLDNQMLYLSSDPALENFDEGREDDESGQKYYSKKNCLAFQKTMLVDAKNVTIQIGEPETIKGKGLKQSYTVYTITTMPYNWVVKRRYSDFEWFLKCLEKRFPAHYVRNKLTLRFPSFLQRVFKRLTLITSHSDFIHSANFWKQYLAPLN